MSVIIAAACQPHIEERHRIIVVGNPAVTSDGVITFFSGLEECVPLLVYQIDGYTQLILPHLLEGLAYRLMVVACVVQVFNHRETCAALIACFCKETTGFFAVGLVSFLADIHVISTNSSEVIALNAQCIIYTIGNES